MKPTLERAKPKQQLEKDSDKKAQAKKNLSSQLIGAAVIGLAVFAGTLFFGGSGNGPEISSAQIDTNTRKYNNALPLKLETVDISTPASLDKAIIAADLETQEQKESLRKDLAAGHVRLASFYVYDFATQDGDYISLKTSSFNKTIPLTTGGVLIVVPFALGENQIEIRGEIDGVGGITAHVLTKAGPIPLPVLAPGQSIHVPVTL